MQPARFIVIAALAIPFAACGASPLPVSEPHDILGSTVRTVEALRIDPDPPTETCPVPVPGKVTVVDFWATWCAPCIESMDELEALWNRVDREKVALVGVSIDEGAAAPQRKVPSLGVSFPMVYDSAGKLDELYRVGRRVPSTFVVDARGEVRFFVGWSNDEAERRAQIDLLERAVGALSREAR